MFLSYYSHLNSLQGKKITHVPFFFMLPSGESQKHEFQAETRQLLDIVARTLYSEKEVLVLTDYDE